MGEVWVRYGYGSGYGGYGVYPRRVRVWCGSHALFLAPLTREKDCAGGRLVGDQGPILSSGGGGPLHVLPSLSSKAASLGQATTVVAAQ